MSESKYKISILVPVYKVPHHLLRRCIESLIKQSMSEIEIILVDDGSPDLCGSICDEYKQKDDRIKVVHQENKGLSGARNSAYFLSNGEYVMFVDGDDYIEKETCEVAYKYATEKKVDVVMWDYVCDYSNSYVEKHSFNEEKMFFDKKGCLDLQEKVLEFDGRISQVFCKLIKRDFLNENQIIHNEELKQGAEGIVFNFVLFGKANSAFYIRKCLNHYVYNDNSITHFHNEANYNLILKCFEHILSMSSKAENFKRIEQKIYDRMLHVIITTGVSGYFNPTYKEKYRNKVRKYKKYMSNELVATALKKGDKRKLSFLKKILIICNKINFIFPYYVAGKLRRMQYKNKWF